MERTKTRRNGNEWCRLEVRLTDEDGHIRLSVCGSAGRVAGNGKWVLETCGQIRDDLKKWFPEDAPFFKWHLNDMHAECPHQEERGETYQTHPAAVCPDCGYELGSAWTRRELPPEVIAWAEGVNEEAA